MINKNPAFVKRGCPGAAIYFCRPWPRLCAAFCLLFCVCAFRHVWPSFLPGGFSAQASELPQTLSCFPCAIRLLCGAVRPSASSAVQPSCGHPHGFCRPWQSVLPSILNLWRNGQPASCAFPCQISARERADPYAGGQTREAEAAASHVPEEAAAASLPERLPKSNPA